MFWDANILIGEKASVLHQIMSRLDLVLLVEVGRDDPLPCTGFVMVPGASRQNRSPRGPGKGQGMVAYIRSEWAPYYQVAKVTAVEWGKLQADIATFQSMGPVSVFGDLNCHTLVADDTGDSA